MWRVDDSVEYIKAHVRADSIGRCAEFTRRAIEAGGLTLIRRPYAKDYGVSLAEVGFVRLADMVVDYEPGDVVVIAGFPRNTAGHMAMFTGSVWMSDFRQTTLYPGPAYRRARPAYVIYRFHQREESGFGLETVRSRFDDN